MCAYHRSDAHVRTPNHFQNSLSWGKQMRFTLMKLHAELELGSESLGREGRIRPPSLLKRKTGNLCGNHWGWARVGRRLSAGKVLKEAGMGSL